VAGQRAKDPSPPTVIVIDDDSGVRESIGRLLRSAGFQVHLLSSVNEFLDTDLPEGPTCLVLDVRLPGQSGLELQRELAAAKKVLPIVFITGHADIPMSVQAMKGGAIEFLTKPFRDQDLLEAIQLGHARHRGWLEQEMAVAELRARFETLTAREREIIQLLAEGRSNKEAASVLGISVKTIEAHRANIMRKLHLRSVSELVRYAVRNQIVQP